MRRFKLLWLTIAISGCAPGGEFPVAPVTGVVECEGSSVPHVTVFFEPLQKGNETLVGKQGLGAADEQGRFQISTYGNNDGAVVGKHRVRVGPPNRELHADFNCPCVLNPEVNILEFDVTADGPNEVKVVLTKKTGRARPSLDDLEALEEARIGGAK